jgi:hypothetical protein
MAAAAMNATYKHFGIERTGEDPLFDSYTPSQVMKFINRLRNQLTNSDSSDINYRVIVYLCNALDLNRVIWLASADDGSMFEDPQFENLQLIVNEMLNSSDERIQSLIGRFRAKEGFMELLHKISEETGRRTGGRRVKSKKSSRKSKSRKSRKSKSRKSRKSRKN